MAVVSAQVVFDFRNEPNTTNWTHPDITIIGGSLKVENGVLRKNGAGKSALFYKNTGEAVVIAFVESETKANFDYGAPGAFTAQGAGFVAAPVGGRIRLQKVSQSQELSVLTDTDINTDGYLASDIIGLQYSDTDDTVRSLKNNATIITKNSDTYSGLLHPGVLIAWGNNNTNGVRSFGFDGVYAIGLGIVGTDNTFRQGQKDVRIKINGLPSSSVTALSIAGVSTAFVTDGPAHIKFDAPFDLANGVVSVAATIDGVAYNRDAFPVAYVQTHPYPAVVAGTTVHSRSIASEMDNPGGRYLKFTIPSQLQFLPPYTELDEDAQSVSLNTVLGAKAGTPENTVHVITGTALDQDGIETPFEIEVLSRSVDRTPAPVSFTSLTDQARDTEFTSNTVLIEDIDDEVVLAVDTTGDPATVKVNGVADALTAMKGDSITLTLQSSTGFEQKKEAILLLDGIEAARYSVTTLVDPGDIIPPALVSPISIVDVFSTSFGVLFEPDETCTYRIVVLPFAAAAPTATAVYAGGITGSLYESPLSDALANVQRVHNVVAFPADTEFTAYLAMQDASGNLSILYSDSEATVAVTPIDKTTKFVINVLAPTKRARQTIGPLDHDGITPPTLPVKDPSSEITVALNFKELVAAQLITAHDVTATGATALVITETEVEGDIVYIKLVGGLKNEEVTVSTSIETANLKDKRSFVMKVDEI
ncbi:MAG: hypothetical protein CME36_09655 [unclassified Hahellaceae]|nr:hypothetical protein [Hahellaceae bacterium]|tara:strand:- start:44813 stop:46927 length:2115 start_codon:yes stop_codon:yes gene_type:complete